MGVLCDWQIKRDIQLTPFHDGAREEGKISSGLTSYGYDARLGYRFRIFTPALCAEVDPKAFDPKALVAVDLSPLPHRFKNMTKSMRDKRFWQCADCKESVEMVDPANDAGPPCPGREQPPDFIRIPPNSFVLAETLETFKIPRDCLGVCLGKSTYARCGIIVNVTPLEPEWEGKVTVEISNTSPLPARVYAGEGIMQVLFLRSDGHRQVIAEVLQGLKPEDWPYTITAAYTGNSPADMTCKTSYADKKGKFQGQTGITLPFVPGAKGPIDDDKQRG